jgi:hypothetical protein
MHQEACWMLNPKAVDLLVVLGDCSGLLLLLREELLREELLFLRESQEIDIFFVTYMSALA